MTARYLALAACIGTWIGWNAYVTGQVSPGAVVFFAMLGWTSYRWGLRVERAAGLSLGVPFDLLAGLLGINTLLFTLRLASTASMPVHLGVIGALGVVDGLLAWRSRAASGDASMWAVKDARCHAEATAAANLGTASCERPPRDGRQGWTECLAIVVALVGVTFWSQESLNAVEHDDSACVFRPWWDTFVHARLISQLAEPAVPMQNLRVGGYPAPAYHYASYLLPAILTGVSSTPAYQAVVGFLIPLASLLGCLAAYTLGRYWWGPWGGVAGVAAILLPDVAFQGTGNYYMGYQWLTQVSYGLSFGNAVAALAWLAMFEACRRGRWRGLAIAYALLTACLAYKAHLLVANALLMGLYPALFIPSWPRWRRVGWAVAAVAAFLTATECSRHNVYWPQAALFGGAHRSEYVRSVVSATDNASLRDWLPTIGGKRPKLLEMAVAAMILAILSFGTFAIWGPLVWAMIRRHCPTPVAAFPWLVVANYLAMAVSMRANRSVFGTRDEFLHRPLVWAYFVVIVWTMGALVSLAGQSRFGQRRASRWAFGLLLAAVALAPCWLGRDLQEMPSFGSPWTNRKVPDGLLACCDFLRRQTDDRELVVDSQADPFCVVAAMSERTLWFSRDSRNPKLAAYRQRCDEFDEWLEKTDAAEIRCFAASRGLRYILVHPGDAEHWPASITERPAFSAGDYRVCRLDDRPADVTVHLRPQGDRSQSSARGLRQEHRQLAEKRTSPPGGP